MRDLKGDKQMSAPIYYSGALLFGGPIHEDQVNKINSKIPSGWPWEVNDHFISCKEDFQYPSYWDYEKHKQEFDDETSLAQVIEWLKEECPDIVFIPTEAIHIDYSQQEGNPVYSKLSVENNQLYSYEGEVVFVNKKIVQTP